jgi:hypothetical protein
VRKWGLRIAVVTVTVFAVLQLVPYGWTHSNPRVVKDAPWPNARAERIARQSCYDCHSFESDWPAYSYVAPMSWLVRYDVDQARHEFNFSDWDQSGGDADKAIEKIEEGDMPLPRYTLIHRGAELSSAEKRILIDALSRMGEND